MIITYEWGGKLRDIEFDAVMRASDMQSSTVTSHPVEKGAPANDHVRKNQDHFSVDAVVSDTPIREFAGGTTNPQSSMTPRASYAGAEVKYNTIERANNGIAGTGVAADRVIKENTTTLQVMTFDGEDFSRVRDVYAECKLIQDNGLLVSVRQVDPIGFRDYTNMIVTGLTVPTDTDGGTTRTFSFQLQEMRIVETRKVKAPQAKAQTKHHGEKGKKEVDAEKDKQLDSTLEQGKQFAKDTFERLKSWAGAF